MKNTLIDRLCVAVRVFSPVWLVLLTVMGPICGAASGETGEATAKVAVFLQRSAATDDAASVALKSLSLVSTSGERLLSLRWSELTTDRERVDQELLAVANVAPGVYTGLTFRFGEVRAKLSGQDVILAPLPDSMEIELGLRLEAGETRAVLLAWTPLTGEAPDSLYEVRLRTIEPTSAPSGSLAFVSCTGDDMVSVLDRFSHRVIEILPGGSRPKGLAYSRTGQQLFVAVSGDDRILVYDTEQRQLVREIPLIGGDEPTRLHIGPFEDELYALNSGSNSLSVIDMGSYQETSRFTLSATPTAMVLDALTSRLYISSDRAGEITVFDTGTKQVVGAFSVTGEPGELIFDSQDRLLVAALESQRALSIIDSQTGAQQSLMAVCARAAGFAQNEGSGQIYAALSDCKEIGMLRVADELTLGRIRLRGKPGLLTLDPEGRRLFAVMTGENRVVIVNVNSKRTEGEIEVGNAPFQVLIPE